MGKRGPLPSKGDAKQRIGDLPIHKGSTPDGIPVVMWDCIPECEEERCNVYAVCPYDKFGKCKIRKEYLDYVYRHYIGTVDGANKSALFKIGMALVPLYSHLITLKIATYGTPATYFDAKGGVRVNPLYREVRQTLHQIMVLANDVLGSKAIGGDGGFGDDLTGNSDYYDNLFKCEAARVDRKMRNRV